MNSPDLVPELAQLTATIRDAKLLIVDDEASNIALLEDMLDEANCCQVQSTTDSYAALDLIRSFAPDLILLDLMMPGLDGFGVMEQLQAAEENCRKIPILVLTADITMEARRRALGKGAADFLTKPFDAIELLLRIQHLLQSRLHQTILEAQVRERTQDLARAQLETLQRLAIAAEYRDDDTGLHTRRVGLISARLAECLGLPQDKVALIEQSAPLHDVGKIGIPDAILLKPGKLTDEEFAIMKQHTVIGGKILSGSSSPFLHKAEEIAISHHERWNGRGYPSGLRETDIPTFGRIVAVADVFDALTHSRPYKAAWPVPDAVAEIQKQSGEQFDPRIVDAFMKLPHDTFV